MRAMKDSGIKWIGEIPVEWEVRKISHIYDSIGSGTTPKSSYDIYYSEDGHNWLQTGDLNDYKIFQTSKKITDKAIEDCNLKYYPKKSLVMAMYGATIGKLGILEIPTYTNQACCVMNGGTIHHYKYGFYSLMSSRDYIINLAFGGGQPNISQDTIRKTKMPIPPLSEQQRIATYLDTKCGEIDELIGVQEKFIEELKAYKQSVITEAVTKGLNPNATLKDSGVEWIGEIPEEWEVCRIKNKIQLNPNTDTDLNSDDTVSFMPMQCLRNGVIIPQEAIYENVKNYTHFQDGDVVMAKVTPCFENGNIAVADNLINKNGFGTSEIFVLRSSDSYYNKYLFYYLQTSYIKNTGVSSMTGTGGLKRVNPTILNCSKILFPPFSEQQAIATYLDTKCSQIDSLIALKQTKIDELKAFKKSLIYEYVTGKKTVPETV